MIDLAGRQVVIIGGSTGIGLATARLCLERGARVTVTGRRPEALAQAASSLGEAVDTAAFDGRDVGAMTGFLDGRAQIDHLVLTMNSGGGVAPLRDLTDERFRQVFENKFWPYVTAIRHAGGRLPEDGSLTLVTGAAARKAIAGMAGIAATNGALHAMLGPLALELAPRRVNAVSPGVIDTPYWRTVDEPKRKEMFARAADSVPVRRVGEAEDMAEAVLLAMTNAYMTGAIIDCDGGVRVS